MSPAREFIYVELKLLPRSVINCFSSFGSLNCFCSLFIFLNVISHFVIGKTVVMFVTIR